MLVALREKRFRKKKAAFPFSLLLPCWGASAAEGGVELLLTLKALLQQLLECWQGVSVSYAINFGLKTVIIPSRFRFRSSSLRRVFADYYFYVGALVQADGLCGRRLKTELGTSSSRLLWMWLVGGLDSCS